MIFYYDERGKTYPFYSLEYVVAGFHAKTLEGEYLYFDNIHLN